MRVIQFGFLYNPPAEATTVLCGKCSQQLFGRLDDIRERSGVGLQCQALNIGLDAFQQGSILIYI